jgi:hypothetical protein
LLGGTTVEQPHHPQNLSLENPEALAAGVAQSFYGEQLHVSKHHVQRGPQVMSDSVEIHDATSEIGWATSYVASGLLSHWKN